MQFFFKTVGLGAFVVTHPFVGRLFFYRGIRWVDLSWCKFLDGEHLLIVIRPATSCLCDPLPCLLGTLRHAVGCSVQSPPCNMSGTCLMRQATLLLGNLFILNCKQLVSSLGHFQQNSCLLVEKPKIALGKLCLGWMSSVARDTSGSLLWLPRGR